MSDRKGSSISLRLRALLAVALLARLGFWLVAPVELMPDSRSYLDPARNLVDGRGYTSTWTGGPELFRPPTYPVFLALFMVLGLDRLPVIALVQQLLGVLSVAAVYVTGRELHRRVRASPAEPAWYRDPALFAGYLLAVDPSSMAQSGTILSEPIFSVLLLGFMALCLDGPGSGPGSLRRPLLAGILGGLMVLCRPGGLLLLPAGLLFAAVGTGVGPSGPRLRGALVTGLVASALVGAWLARNRSANLDGLTAHGGVTLGDMLYHFGVSSDRDLWTEENGMLPAQGVPYNALDVLFRRGLSVVEADVRLKKYGSDVITQHPVRYMAGCLRSAADTFFGLPDWLLYGPISTKMVDDFRGRRAGLFLFKGLVRYALPLGVYALCLGAPFLHAGRARLLLLVFALNPFLTLTAASAISPGQTRYRHPLDGLIYIPAAMALFQLVSRPSRGRSGGVT